MSSSLQIVELVDAPPLDSDDDGANNCTRRIDEECIDDNQATGLCLLESKETELLSAL